MKLSELLPKYFEFFFLMVFEQVFYEIFFGQKPFLLFFVAVVYYTAAQNLCGRVVVLNSVKVINIGKLPLMFSLA